MAADGSYSCGEQGTMYRLAESLLYAWSYCNIVSLYSNQEKIAYKYRSYNLQHLKWYFLPLWISAHPKLFPGCIMIKKRNSKLLLWLLFRFIHKNSFYKMYLRMENERSTYLKSTEQCFSVYCQLKNDR